MNKITADTAIMKELYYLSTFVC